MPDVFLMQEMISIFVFEISPMKLFIDKKQFASMQNMNLRNENFILQKVSHFIARYQVKCLIFLLFVIGLQPSKNTIYSITDLDYSIEFSVGFSATTTFNSRSPVILSYFYFSIKPLLQVYHLVIGFAHNIRKCANDFLY